MQLKLFTKFKFNYLHLSHRQINIYASIVNCTFIDIMKETDRFIFPDLCLFKELFLYALKKLR